MFKILNEYEYDGFGKNDWKITKYFFNSRETNDTLELDEVQVEIIINQALNSLFGEVNS